MIDFETPISRVLRGTRKIDLRAALAPMGTQWERDFWNEVTKGFTTNNDSVVWDNKPYEVTSPAKVTQNFVAVLKGDVNGSWAAPAGSEKLADSYFTDLVAHNPNSMQLSQWGVIAV